MIAHLSIGTNIGDKRQNLIIAIDMLNKFCGTIIKQSSIYETNAWGFESSNSFYNIAVAINTNLSPQKLLDKLFFIENEIGRERQGVGYSDRLIDIDIIFYDNETITTDKLQIPHPLLQARNFVLYPMCEICPEFTHSKFNKTIKELKEASTDNSIIKVVTIV